jgi:hypothetical protein
MAFLKPGNGLDRVGIVNCNMDVQNLPNAMPRKEADV